MSQVAVQPTGSAPEMRTVGMSPSAARGGSLLDVRVQTQAWRVAGQRAPVGSLNNSPVTRRRKRRVRGVERGEEGGRRRVSWNLGEFCLVRGWGEQGGRIMTPAPPQSPWCSGSCGKGQTRLRRELR